MNALLAGLALELRPGSAVYLHVLPMVLLVSVIWGATRHESWPDIVGHALRFAAMVFVFMAGVLAFLLLAPLFPWYVWAAVVVGLILYFRLSHPHQEPAKQ
jgi:hypothetical protein